MQVWKAAQKAADAAEDAKIAAFAAEKERILALRKEHEAARFRSAACSGFASSSFSLHGSCLSLMDESTTCRSTVVSICAAGSNTRPTSRCSRSKRSTPRVSLEP